jgi:hypothetical protein
MLKKSNIEDECDLDNELFEAMQDWGQQDEEIFGGVPAAAAANSLQHHGDSLEAGGHLGFIDEEDEGYEGCQ